MGDAAASAAAAADCSLLCAAVEKGVMCGSCLGAPPASCDLLMAAAHAHWQFERRKKGAAYSLFAQSSRAPNPPQAPLASAAAPDALCVVLAAPCS